jgi:hypothetical protein
VRDRRESHMKKRSPGGCTSLLLLLFLVFLVLRLAGAVAWSWWWVASPLWLPAALVLVTFVVLGFMGVGVYKVVAAVLRKQDFGAARRSTAKAPGASVLEAEGTEVAPRPSAADDRADGGSGRVGLPPAGGTD